MSEYSATPGTIQPFPNSRKVYVNGSRPGLRVPMREIDQSPTPEGFGGEINPPIPPGNFRAMVEAVREERGATPRFSNANKR